MNLIDVTKETLNILNTGYYDLNGKKIILTVNPKDFEMVRVIKPTDVLYYINEIRNIQSNSLGKIIIDELDTFDSARINGTGRTVVLNFANAFYPGGGFLKCSLAQEESLCRCSSLYASISSDSARIMYEYNNANKCPQGSDYMLLSENVVVFRNSKDLSLLLEPFQVDVITFAAPNLYYEAHYASDTEVATIFQDKIDKLLAVLASFKYDTIILGAWGCGAFGNDAKKVADYFYNSLVIKNFVQYFKKIVFSIYTGAKIKSRYNYISFKNRFEK